MDKDLSLMNKCDTAYLKMLRFKSVCDIINSNYNGRKIVFLGDSDYLRDYLLAEYNIKNQIIATQLKEKLANPNHYMLDSFYQKSKDYYIVIPFLPYDTRLVNLLVRNGYEEYKDFVFAYHKKIILTSPVINYSDEYGNEIDCPAPGLKIVIAGIAGNTKIKIHKTVRFGTNCKLAIYNGGASLEIEEKCSFGDNALFELFILSNVLIKKNTTTETFFVLHDSAAADILIEEDCMMSHHVTIHAGDGHAIFDTVKKCRTNDFFPDNSKCSIHISPHCWLGYGCFVLHNTKIEKSCIIGASALVKGVFPNNCIIGGNPSKIIKKNVTWHRHPYETDINQINDIYIDHTSI